MRVNNGSVISVAKCSKLNIFLKNIKGFILEKCHTNATFVKRLSLFNSHITNTDYTIGMINHTLATLAVDLLRNFLLFIIMRGYTQAKNHSLVKLVVSLVEVLLISHSIIFFLLRTKFKNNKYFSSSDLASSYYYTGWPLDRETGNFFKFLIKNDFNLF